MRTTAIHRLTPIAIALAMVPTAPLMAQQLMLEEVVVTAQKREQSLQDVPIAVSAMSGDRIDDIGITDLEQVALYIPNVNINQGQATSNIFIRGVGSGTNQGFEQSVGLYIDGLYSGRGQLAKVPLTLDLARVEVLKGPQGILFGKNTIGGAINITTARPDFETGGLVEALYDPDHGEQILTGVLTGGLSDNLAGRLAVRYEGMDGWWENETLDKEGPDKDNLFIRGSLLWEATDTLEIIAKYEHGDFETLGRPQVVYQSDQPTNYLGQSPFPVLDDHDRGAGDILDTDDTELDVALLTLNWDIDVGTFTSITGYATYDTVRNTNSDIAAVPALNRFQEEEYEQFSQEVRLVSPGGETLDWIVGAYYQSSELSVAKTNTDTDFLQSGPLSVAGLTFTTDERIPTQFDQDSTSWAVFAQGTYALTDTLRLGLGLRYNEEEKDLDKAASNPGLGARLSADFVVLANPASGILIEDLRSHSFQGLERDEDKVTWSANLQWDVTDDSMVYASISTGYKGGGFDEAYSNAGPTARTGNIFTGEPDGGVVDTGVDSSILNYDEETVLAYELGAKMTLADGAANLNLAIFRMEYDDLQVSSLVGDVFRVGNAGESVSQGVEVDGRWLLAEGFTLGGAVAYLDATYDTFTGATCTVPQVSDPVANPGCLSEDGTNIAPGERGGQDLSGETLLFAPEWSGNLNAEWILPLGDNLELRNNLDVNFTSSFYSSLDLDPNTKHDSATKVNLRIALASISDSWSLAVIGKNLTDEKTMIWRNDVALTDSNSYFGVPERGRSVAVQARYRF
ncbi:TonB-dependent receptor [Pseudohalioglobus lutimaris]|uniref:TonB-dependent receptor n=1 Tax=Pseudohalioglobus lutimaris TaxID=1737061 RepID=A0A2N5X5U2_9GAMM|nr:TonB-dependent receptor [Pseudohalioglobus lutimaris]PLW69841.1 TonB-dependent receptor [Pseudohalioglobus lutimaris]